MSQTQDAKDEEIIAFYDNDDIPLSAIQNLSKQTENVRNMKRKNDKTCYIENELEESFESSDGSDSDYDPGKCEIRKCKEKAAAACDM